MGICLSDHLQVVLTLSSERHLRKSACRIGPRQCQESLEQKLEALTKQIWSSTGARHGEITSSGTPFAYQCEVSSKISVSALQPLLFKCLPMCLLLMCVFWISSSIFFFWIARTRHMVSRVNMHCFGRQSNWMGKVCAVSWKTRFQSCHPIPLTLIFEMVELPLGIPGF